MPKPKKDRVRRKSRPTLKPMERTYLALWEGDGRRYGRSDDDLHALWDEHRDRLPDDGRDVVYDRRALAAYWRFERCLPLERAQAARSLAVAAIRASRPVDEDDVMADAADVAYDDPR